MYRIFNGTDGVCHNIAGAAPGMTCQQYTNGGFNGPMDCGNERIEAGSLEIYGNVYCQIYGSQDCISASKILYGCGNPTAGAWSFQCVSTPPNVPINLGVCHYWRIFASVCWRINNRLGAMKMRAHFAWFNRLWAQVCRCGFR